MRVEVTAEDISRGATRSACLCPVALAVVRAFNTHLYGVVVGAGYILLGNAFGNDFGRERGKRWWAPPEVDDKPVSPFTFELTDDRLAEE